ncbi:hypothetical protein [Nocardia sp. alder85J]|uniref:hypothetical protein n=1 Tax=Nocardia sp. alder85J TaxID=2862949 RepID=UPI001CD3617A|nr:hypothetical protein [Nocardia sp. alder85J]MCX4097627.1 hypothetical protein [Nocardia sp. alder85J]
MGRRFALALLAGLPWQAVGTATGAPKPDVAQRMPTRYTMTAFRADSDTTMAVYESVDGTRFTPVAERAYTPPTGLVRDPSVMLHSDGWYHVTYTMAADATAIGMARSRNRVDWTPLAPVPMLVSGRLEGTWAPEWYTDAAGRVGIVVSLTWGHGFTPHLLVPLGPDLTAWSPPIPLRGIGPRGPDSLGFIDTELVPLDGRVYAFVKNEDTKLVELAVADHPLGPYRFVAQGDWAGWGGPREGPSVVPLPDGGHRIHLDAYTEGRYLYSDSYDGFRTWSAPAEVPGLSGVVRHGTVLAEFDPPTP